MNVTVGRVCPQRAESDVLYARRAARRDGLALPKSNCELLRANDHRPTAPRERRSAIY